MTHSGGWKTYEKREELPEKPTDGKRPPDPGRYRAIERRGSKFGDTLWMWESDDAKDHYRTERSRDRLDGMDLKELVALLEGEDYDEIRQDLSSHEIRLAHIEERLAERERGDVDNDSAFEERVLEAAMRGDIDAEPTDLDAARTLVENKVDLERARRGLGPR